MNRADLRSDTTTLPTEEMRQAMHRAELGDDVYGEDPTVKALEELAAAKVGMEAALFVPSGTMANTCALLAHTSPGEEVVFEELAHMYNWECGTYANIAGLAARPLRGVNGILKPEDIESVIRPFNIHFAMPTLLCLENTNNNAAGTAWSPAQMQAVAETARANGLKVHIDGARLFNAAVYHGVGADQYGRHVDSLMFCVSKGLSAPVGSLLCGSRDFITKAHAMRKRLGGAMRQAGVVAAAGIVALETMIDRLADDHANAQRLCQGLDAIPGFKARQAPTPTNIIMVDVSELGWTSAHLLDSWRQHGILGNARPPHGVRLLTHRHISAADVEYVIETTAALVASTAA
jgi:threonine aldolase